jgi:hypothetical protein
VVGTLVLCAEVYSQSCRKTYLEIHDDHFFGHLIRNDLFMPDFVTEVLHECIKLYNSLTTVYQLQKITAGSDKMAIL